MPGTRTNAFPVRHVFTGYKAAAVAAADILGEYVVLFPCRISAVKVYAITAGTGAASTVVDILKNGASIYAAAGDKPTLLAVSTGEFANVAPSTRALQPGDRLLAQVATISDTGHARLMSSVALEVA